MVLESLCRESNNIHINYSTNSLNFISNLFIIPFLAKRMKIDIVLFQNFTPFLFHSSIKYIVYVHDFLFLDTNLSFFSFLYTPHVF